MKLPKLIVGLGVLIYPANQSLAAAQKTTTQITHALTVFVHPDEARTILSNIPWIVRQHHRPARCCRPLTEYLYRRYYQNQDPLNVVNYQLSPSRRLILESIALAYTSGQIENNQQIQVLTEELEIAINAHPQPLKPHLRPLAFTIMRLNPNNRSAQDLFNPGAGLGVSTSEISESILKEIKSKN